MNPIFLFSIDLEDVRLGVFQGNKYKDRVTINTLRYLDWLEKNNFNCTFFTTGDIAKNHPKLIDKIIKQGHEIACHTTNHIPLDQQTPSSFKNDLVENIRLLRDAGAIEIKGFRAPVLSLVEKTKWAYDVLEELDFTYSSSVLPAKNPLYGWKEFGVQPKNVNSKIVEIPISVGKIGGFVFPIAGGIYFRVLPLFLTKTIITKQLSGMPLISYFHPYDIDNEQEKFMHGGINESKFYNWLMYYNRSSLFDKLDCLIKSGYKITTYGDFLKQLKL